MVAHWFVLHSGRMQGQEERGAAAFSGQPGHARTHAHTCLQVVAFGSIPVLHAAFSSLRAWLFVPSASSGVHGLTPGVKLAEHPR